MEQEKVLLINKFVITNFIETKLDEIKNYDWINAVELQKYNKNIKQKHIDFMVSYLLANIENGNICSGEGHRLIGEILRISKWMDDDNRGKGVLNSPPPLVNMIECEKEPVLSLNSEIVGKIMKLEETEYTRSFLVGGGKNMSNTTNE